MNTLLIPLGAILILATLIVAVILITLQKKIKEEKEDPRMLTDLGGGQSVDKFCKVAWAILVPIGFIGIGTLGLGIWQLLSTTTGG